MVELGIVAIMEGFGARGGGGGSGNGSDEEDEEDEDEQKQRQKQQKQQKQQQQQQQQKRPAKKKEEEEEEEVVEYADDERPVSFEHLEWIVRKRLVVAEGCLSQEVLMRVFVALLDESPHQALNLKESFIKGATTTRQLRALVKGKLVR